jgi:dienelactone hydrolase
MDLPRTNYDAPFDITRTSHVVLTVKDLEASRLFYTEVIGLIVTAQDGDTLYLRRIEEACHHSLVLRRAGDAAACLRIGLRVIRDADLDRLKAHFESRGCTAQWAEVAHQGRTLQATDVAGVPLEFCATMPVVPRMITQFHLHRGGMAHRLDHYQVLIPDVRGLSEHYRDVARRFAAEGYFTLAVDLYSREGAPTFADMDAVFRWIRALPDTRVLSDLAAAVAYLGGRPEVSAGAIGITGFCMGGQYALMAACTVPGLSACVSWYGMLRYAETDAVKPASPLDLAPELRCPYLGLFGEEDAIIPLADVEELRAILSREEKRFEIVTYPGAGHAFFNDTRADVYRPAAAADAWPRALAFLRRELRVRDR